METERDEELSIRRKVVDDILAHARDEAPNECCGLLIGESGRIKRARRARNLLESPSRFLVDPSDHFAALREAREEGLHVIGAYHSHPDSVAVPSAIDLAESIDTELLHVIASLAAPDGVGQVRGFRLFSGNFREVRLVLLA